MKRIISLMLALVMIVAMVAPATTYAVELSKEEVLFNKLQNDFGSMLDDLDSDEIDVLLEVLDSTTMRNKFYDIFDDLFDIDDLDQESEVRGLIADLLTEANLLILIEELADDAAAVESLDILRIFIAAVEETLDKTWVELIALGSTEDILAGLEVLIDDEVDGSGSSGSGSSGGGSSGGSSSGGGSVIIIPAPLTPSFYDMGNHWSKTYVVEMAKEGILNGYPDGSFNPNGLVTRAEFSKMIVSVLKLTVVDYTTGFSDVFVNDWFADYVATMASKNYVAGYPDGTFKPNDNISRAEMAKILSNVIEVSFTQEESAALISGFADANEIPEWSLDAVAEVAKAGLIQGDNNNNFNPTDNATRGEAAAVIYRLFNK